MYSAELSYGFFNEMQSKAPKTLKGVLDKLNSCWVSLSRSQDKRYEVYDSIPEEFELLLQRALSRITDYLAEHPTHNEPTLLPFTSKLYSLQPSLNRSDPIPFLTSR